MDFIAHLNNGQIIEVNNPQFDAASFTQTLNENNTHFVHIGNAVINKHLIQLIIPADIEE
jgi:hypothetical protein